MDGLGQYIDIWVISFYLIIIFIIYKFRKKFDFQAKFIALLRTKVGLKWMDKQAEKYRPYWVLFGYIAIGVGFVAMIAISYLMLDSLWNVITNPNAPPGVAPVLPGVKIPGVEFFVPFWYGIIALFVVVLVHESAHGLVARAHKIPVKNTGIVFFGPLIGAFVEPDDKVLLKRNEIQQYSVFAAGPVSNMVLTAVALLLLGWVVSPLVGAITVPGGFSFGQVQEGYPTEAAGVEAGMVFSSVNGAPVLTATDFLAELSGIRPNETIILKGDDGTFEITATNHPDNKEKGYIGIIGIDSHPELKYDTLLFKALNGILEVVGGLLYWIAILSVGIGLANLLPLGPVDGGRMILLALQSFTTKKKADIIWKKISVLTLLVLLLNLLWPLFRWIFNGIIGIF